MDAQELIQRAEKYCFLEDAALILREIEAAQMRVVTANATPARKQAERSYKRTLARLVLLEHEYEDDKYQADGAKARAEYDAEQQAAAWSRGVDYQTEMRSRSHIWLLYGAGGESDD